MAIYKVLFEKLYAVLILLTMSLFLRLFTDWEHQKDHFP